MRKLNQTVQNRLRAGLGWALAWLLAATTSLGAESEGDREGGVTMPAVLTNAAQVLRLGVDGALRNPHPVELTGVVTCPLTGQRWLYVQDATAGILVLYTNRLRQVETGQVVQVRGRVYAGQFAAHVAEAEVRVVGQGRLPEPKRAEAARLAAGEDFGEWVAVEGRVVDVFTVSGTAVLELVSGTTRFLVFGRNRETGPIRAGREPPLEWLDAKVEVRGICWTDMDELNRPIGFRMLAPGSDCVRVLSPGNADLFDRPAVPMGGLRPSQAPADPRVRVAGTVTHSIPRQWLFLEDGTHRMRVRLLPPLGRSEVHRVFRDRGYQQPVVSGDVVEVVGHVQLAGLSLALRDAEYRVIGRTNASPPAVVAGSALAAGTLDAWLVTLRAQLIGRQTRVWGAGVEELLVLAADGMRFKATLRTDRTNTLPTFERNALIEVTGVCLMRAGELGASSSPELLLRSEADVVGVRPPHPWESLAPGRILAVSGGLGLVALAWIGLLLRQIRHRTRAEARLRRSEATTRIISYFATSLLEQQDAEDILWDLAQNCVARLGFVECVVYLMDEPRKELVQKAAYGPKSPAGRILVNPLRLPLGQGIVGAVATNGRAEIVSDTRGDERYIVDDARRLSEIAVPIMAHGTVLGVIDSEHPEAGFFTDEHVEILSSVASLCANKLVRLRAEQRLRDLNRELEERIHQRTAELVEANTQLRASDERFGKAFRSTPAVLSIMRSSDERLIEVNEAFLAVSGFTRDEVLGRTTSELGLWVDQAARAEFVREARTAGGVKGFEARLRSKSGVEEIVLMSAEPIDLNGEACVLVLTLVVTARKRAEEELLRTLAQERELSELKGRFVSIVSHEFRTPLGIIMSSAEILDHYLDRLPAERRREHLADIHGATRQMAGLMEEVLILGRAEAGQLEFKPAALDLAALCRRVSEEVGAATLGRCAIRTELASPLPPACGDASLVRHILINLLTNAVKYSPAGAAVDFRVGVRDGGAEFQVQDRGIGIPEKDRRRLFQAFYRGANVGETPGNGLGLMIVQRCVELHHGRIAFASSQGAGTTFTVWLPVYPSEARSGGEPGGPGGRGGAAAPHPAGAAGDGSTAVPSRRLASASP